MYRLFSVDDHIMEPKHLWVDRASAADKERVPHVVTDPKTGNETWVWEGGHCESAGLYAVAGQPPEKWNWEPAKFSDMIPGCYDPKERARDFLGQGICASAAFPTLQGFSGDGFLKFADKELASRCVEAYNDFILDEWCPSGPKGLFVPLILTKLWDPEATAKEIYRCVAKGARGISFTENPTGFGLPSFWTNHWDPVWRACEETNIAVCMHIGTGNTPPTPSPEAPMTLFISLSYTAAMIASLNLAMSTVCRRFEKLKLVFSEGGLGWLPAAMERADFQWLKHGAWTKLTGTLPSEIIKRNMYFCMIQEPWAFHSKDVRDAIGEDHIFWESDYPHADTPFPHTQVEAHKMFDGVPQDVVDKAAFKNAEKVFNWKMADLDSPEVQAILKTSAAA